MGEHVRVAMIVCLLSVTGCGSDPFGGLEDESDFGPERSEVSGEAGATQAVAGATGLGGMLGADSIGEASVGAIGVLSAAPLQIVSEAMFDFADLDHHAELLRPRGASPGHGSFASFPDCVELGEDVVRFRDCEMSAGGSSTTMNGTIERDGERLVADLDIVAVLDFDGQSHASSTHLSADLLVSETRLDGRVDSETSMNIPGGGSARQTTAAIYDIDLEDGCATGGELRVGVSQRATAGGQSQSLRAIGRAVFGPECGDVTIYARLD
jgi:hypothetical protein